MPFTVSIKTAVAKFKQVRFIQPIIEGITNAIEAGATEVEVTFKIHTYSSPDLFERDVIYKKISGAVVVDNGDGFIEKNRISFAEYLSSLKRELGCKGVGRLSWLKVFKDVKIESTFFEDNQWKKANFIFNFDFERIAPTTIENNLPKENKTILYFDSVREDYFLSVNEPQKDLRCDANIQEITNDIKCHLLPKLVFLKKEGKIFNIKLLFKNTKEHSIINNESIPDLDSKNFEIEDSKYKSHSFELFHKFLSDGNSSHWNYYCANKRAVTPFEFKTNVPGTDSSIMLLTSSYFDERDNDERNKLEIFPVQTADDCPLSMETINGELYNIVTEIMLKKYPDIEKDNAENFSKIADDYPYLAKYIGKQETAGAIDRETIIKTAKRKYEKEKEDIRHRYKKLLSKHGANKKTISEFEEFIKETCSHNQQELAEYICYRQYIINILNKFIEDDEKSEKMIHNLIMKRFTENSAQYGVTENNLWLLDDRFTLYRYAASDKTIEHIVKQVNPDANHEGNQDKPDIALFYSKNPLSQDNEDITTILIELKSFKAKKRDKINGITQLYDYVTELNKACPRLKTFWVYLVTTIDNEIFEILKNQNFYKLISTDGFIIYKSSGVDYTIFVSLISPKSIVSDAEARNKTFLEIVKASKKVISY